MVPYRSIQSSRPRVVAEYLTHWLISAQVFSEITSESLTEVEKAALQLCAARKDADLQAVLEVYRLEGDKDDLLDSVKRIARKTIDETVAAGLPGGGDE